MLVGPTLRHVTCCLTGHRNLVIEERARLPLQLRRAITRMAAREGVERFLCGGARGFDLLAAQAVLQMKCVHTQLRLVMYLPCPNQTRGWQAADVRRYHAVLQAADEVHMLAPAYTADCMLTRNRRMVEDSAFCLAYCRGATGGTAYTLRYAQTCGLRVNNLAARPCLDG